jgi:hypothetical protein
LRLGIRVRNFLPPGPGTEIVLYPRPWLKALKRSEVQSDAPAIVPIRLRRDNLADVVVASAAFIVNYGEKSL